MYYLFRWNVTKRWLFNTNIRCKVCIDALMEVADDVSWGSSSFLRMKTLLAHVIVAMATRYINSR